MGETVGLHLMLKKDSKARIAWGDGKVQVVTGKQKPASEKLAWGEAGHSYPEKGMYLSIAPSDSCLAAFLQHQVQAYGFPHCPVQSLDIDCNLCHNSLFLMFTTAKIMQTSAMKACFQIAECSLSYAKLQVRCVKSWHKRENYLKNLCITLYQ